MYGKAAFKNYDQHPYIAQLMASLSRISAEKSVTKTVIFLIGKFVNRRPSLTSRR